jgi:hypothetical protein
MRTKRRVLLIAAALAVASVLLMRSQNKRGSKLETDHRQLQMLAAEAQRLSNENQRIPELKAAAAQAEQLRTETQDLHKMRNEVHQLRKRQKELKQARADNEQLRLLQATSATSSGPASAAIPFAMQAELADKGQANTEALIQTLFYAMREGDFGRMKECIDISGSPKQPPDWCLARNLETITQVVTGRSWWSMPGALSPEEQRLEMKEFVADFRGVRVVKQVISGEQAELTIQISTVGDNGGIYDVPFQARLIDSEWKLSRKDP